VSSRLSKAQVKALWPYVKGRRVHDLGAGMCIETRMLARLGAARVVAVDKERMPMVAAARIEQRRCYFADLTPIEPKLDVAFVCWPQNYRAPGLAYLCGQANTVVYVGKNTDGTACGSVDLFSTLLDRKVEVYLPERRSSLIIYGAYLGAGCPRAVLGEERACLEGRERIISFEEAEGVVGAIASLKPD